MIQAAIYGASKDRNVDTSFDDGEEFAMFSYEVYLVIERRIRDNDNLQAWGVPRHGKEQTVKQKALEKYESEFESEKPNMKSLYMAVPSCETNRTE